jgi:hypothetical protein
MMTYGGMVEQLHFWIRGWVDLSSGLDSVGKTKITFPLFELNPDNLLRHFVS